MLLVFSSNIRNLRYPILGNARLEKSEFSFAQLSTMERSQHWGFYLPTVLCLAFIEMRTTIKVPAVQNDPVISTRSTTPWSTWCDNHKSKPLVCLEKQHDQIRVLIPAAHLIWGCSVFSPLCEMILQWTKIYIIFKSIFQIYKSQGFSLVDKLLKFSFYWTVLQDDWNQTAF